jgi:hypothetical protein
MSATVGVTSSGRSSRQRQSGPAFAVGATFFTSTDRITDAVCPQVSVTWSVTLYAALSPNGCAVEAAVVTVLAVPSPHVQRRSAIAWPAGEGVMSVNVAACASLGSAGEFVNAATGVLRIRCLRV